MSVLDLNLFSKAISRLPEAFPNFLNPGLLTKKVGRGIFTPRVLRGGKLGSADISMAVSAAQNASRSSGFQGGTSAAGTMGATLAFLAPIILPFLVSKGVQLIKKAAKTKTKKDDRILIKEFEAGAKAMDLEQILANVPPKQLSSASKSILDRVIGTGISIL